MISTRPPLARRNRHALTLLEVLLTLTLLVILASITWPALDRPFANQRLRKSADVVRVQWAKARVRAMSTGETQMFRYVPDGDRFAVEGRAGPEFSSDVASDAELGSLTDSSDPNALLTCTEHTLPTGITFVGGETTFDTRAETVASQTDHLSDTEFGWSDPILFYPDGTTSTATLQLRNEHNRTIELSLRGLTGVVTVGRVQSAEEYVP